MALSASDKREIAAIVAASLAASRETEAVAEVVEVTTPRKRRTASTKSAPKATAARRKRGEKVSEWTVRESWKGSEASPRMLGTACKAGVAAAILKRGDKFEVSAALGKAYGLPVVTQD
jgi:hypothetical protein